MRMPECNTAQQPVAAAGPLRGPPLNRSVRRTWRADHSSFRKVADGTRDRGTGRPRRGVPMVENDDAPSASRRAETETEDSV